MLTCIRSCSFLFNISICFCLASFCFNLCTSFFRHLIYSTEDFSIVPLLGRTSLTISKYGSLFFGSSVPSSFIRSLMLKRRRRSTAKKWYNNKNLQTVCWNLLMLWLSFFWRSLANALSSASLRIKGSFFMFRSDPVREPSLL